MGASKVFGAAKPAHASYHTRAHVRVRTHNAARLFAVGAGGGTLVAALSTDSFSGVLLIHHDSLFTLKSVSTFMVHKSMC
jgi:hypothetical protein